MARSLVCAWAAALMLPVAAGAAAKPATGAASKPLSGAEVSRRLADALVCKGDAAEAVYGLVDRGSDFNAGYAAHGFGEGTSYRAVAVLRDALVVAGAKANAVVSEMENSNPDFRAFTYAQFDGDYRQAVKLLKLQEAKPFNDASIGRYVSQQPKATTCPQTIGLTPIDDKHFLLGCGWCNGG
ncbi:MAG: hypothetical protein V4582_22005 [Pseudomonadota bacterium]